MSSVLPMKKEYPPARMIDYLVVIFGPPGVGKTSLAMCIGGGDPLFFSTDRGTRFIKDGRFAIDCNKWTDVLVALKQLEGDKKARALYSGYVLDHVDDLFVMCEQYVCKRLGIGHMSELEWGKGWSELRKEWTSLINRLLRLEKGIVFIAHDDTKEIEAAITISRVQPAMPKTAWKVVMPLCDICIHVGYRRDKVKVDGKVKRVDRVVATMKPRKDLFVKDRTGRMPEEFILKGPKSGNELVKVFEKGDEAKPVGKQWTDSN